MLIRAIFMITLLADRSIRPTVVSREPSKRSEPWLENDHDAADIVCDPTANRSSRRCTPQRTGAPRRWRKQDNCPARNQAVRVIRQRATKNADAASGGSQSANSCQRARHLQTRPRNRRASTVIGFADGHS
jgi:hypothetical protein